MGWPTFTVYQSGWEGKGPPAPVCMFWDPGFPDPGIHGSGWVGRSDVPTHPHPSLPPCTLLSLVPSVLAFSRLPLWGGTGWPAALEPHLTSFLRFQSTYQSLEKDASIPVLGHMPTPRLMTLFITLRYSDQSGLCVHSWDREDGGTWLITCRLVQRLFLIGRELSARIRIKGC